MGNNGFHPPKRSTGDFFECFYTVRRQDFSKGYLAKGAALRALMGCPAGVCFECFDSRPMRPLRRGSSDGAQCPIGKVSEQAEPAQ